MKTSARLIAAVTAWIASIGGVAIAVGPRPQTPVPAASRAADAASLLPPDDSAYGFDNISDVLGVSPSLQERYLTAAKKVSALAIGDTRITPGSETYRVRQDLSQDQHIEGLPLGTVGGIRVRHTFPLDGEYTFQVKLYRTNLNIVRGLQYAHQVEFTVDGARIHLA